MAFSLPIHSIVCRVIDVARERAVPETLGPPSATPEWQECSAGPLNTKQCVQIFTCLILDPAASAYDLPPDRQ